MNNFLRRVCAAVICLLVTMSSLPSAAFAAAQKTGPGMAEWALRAYNEGWKYVFGSEEVGAVDCSGLIRSYINGGGDKHDIGKNLVAIMLQGAGLNVVDLGSEVTAEMFCDAVEQNNAQIVAMSALLTTTMPYQGEVIKALEARGLRDKVKVMVGGAPVTEEFAKSIGADAYTPDAGSAASRAIELLG